MKHKRTPNQKWEINNNDSLSKFKMLKKKEEKKLTWECFHSIGLEQIKQAMKSITFSHVDITHGCNKQKVKVEN